ncbi:MAG: hypothetical protein WA816_01910 [Bacteroidales bacterium]
MKKVKIIAGISWAFLGLILIIILFPGLNTFSVSASKLPFMKLNSRYTGGEIARQIITASCTLDVRKPVFDGFLKERNTGFVQMDWHGKLPEIIKDSIDYDQDGIKDFCVLIERKDSKTVLDPFNRKVKGVLISTATSYGWAARVKLIK